MIALRSAFFEAMQNSGAEGNPPPCTAIVARKTHSTRFFPKRAEESVGKAGNVQPGLVVDRTVLHKEDFDFFLMAHKGIQGTSCPVHYSVIHDGKFHIA